MDGVENLPLPEEAYQGPAPAARRVTGIFQTPRLEVFRITDIFQTQAFIFQTQAFFSITGNVQTPPQVLRSLEMFRPHSKY